MVNFFPAIWNVLHDGVIVAVYGTVPGTIRLQISIDYLRKRFSQSGEFIDVVLADCTRFTYRASDAGETTTESPGIAPVRRALTECPVRVESAPRRQAQFGQMPITSEDMDFW